MSVIQRSRLYIYKISKFHIHCICIYTYIQAIFKFHIQCIYTVYKAVYIAKYTLFCIYDIYKKVYISYIHIDTQGCRTRSTSRLIQLYSHRTRSTSRLFLIFFYILTRRSSYLSDFLFHFVFFSWTILINYDRICRFFVTICTLFVFLFFF